MSEFLAGFIVALLYALIVYVFVMLYNRDRDSKLRQAIINYFKKVGAKNKKK